MKVYLKNEVRDSIKNLHSSLKYGDEKVEDYDCYHFLNKYHLVSAQILQEKRVNFVVGDDGVTIVTSPENIIEEKDIINFIVETLEALGESNEMES